MWELNKLKWNKNKSEIFTSLITFDKILNSFVILLKNYMINLFNKTFEYNDLYYSIARTQFTR